MIVTLVVTCALGWVVGVWAPWWCILCLIVAFVLASIDDKNFNGLDGGIFQLSIWFAIVTTCLSGFINGDVSIYGVGDIIKTIFTGY